MFLRLPRPPYVRESFSAHFEVLAPPKLKKFPVPSCTKISPSTLFTRADANGPVPLTLDEALGNGSVKVVETGEVNELKIENTGGEPVFIQSGDIVKGGRQDRTLTTSLILPPHSGEIPDRVILRRAWSLEPAWNRRRYDLCECG